MKRGIKNEDAIVFTTKYAKEIIPFLYKKKQSYMEHILKNCGGTHGQYVYILKVLYKKEIIKYIPSKNRRIRLIELTDKGNKY